MFYDRYGRVVQNILPNHEDRRPQVELTSRVQQPLLARISRILVPCQRYNLFIGRGKENGLVAIHWDEKGEYAARMKTRVCELRLSPIIGLHDDTYRASYKLARQVLIFRIPQAHHELERWWYRLPDVSDNPGDRVRKLSQW